MRKKVLIVDDSKSFQAECMDLLPRNEIEILPAYTLDEGRRLFLENSQSIDLIVLDLNVEGELFDTLPLLSEMKETFEGPVLAVANSAKFAPVMLSRGCEYFSDSKEAAPVKIMEILGV